MEYFLSDGRILIVVDRSGDRWTTCTVVDKDGRKIGKSSLL